MSSSPSNWEQLYHGTVAEQEMPPQDDDQGPFNISDRFSSTTSATNAATIGHLTSTTSHMSTEYNLTGVSDAHLYPEGSVSRPSRKRPRASRKAQTTLLNTDITNFRAMVQQFTGVPKAVFSSAPRINIAESFTSAVPIVPYGYSQRQLYQQQPQQQQQQQQQHQQQQQQQQRIIQLLNNSVSNMENSDGFFMNSSSFDDFPTGSSFNDNNKSNGYV